MCTGWRICFLAWLFTICSRTVAPATCRAVTRHRTTISGELRVWVWGAREARRFTSISFCCCTHSGSAISTSAYRDGSSLAPQVPAHWLIRNCAASNEWTCLDSQVAAVKLQISKGAMLFASKHLARHPKNVKKNTLIKAGSSVRSVRTFIIEHSLLINPRLFSWHSQWRRCMPTNLNILFESLCHLQILMSTSQVPTQ